MLSSGHAQSNPTLPGPIRKEILLALDEQIIPALWRRQASLGFVAAPFKFPIGIRARLIDKKVPVPDADPPDFPSHTLWSRAKLHSTHHPYIGFIYQGAADERTLVTAAQASKTGFAKGIYAIRWQAPGLLLFPTGTPHNTGIPRNSGDKNFWAGNEPQPAVTKILWLRICSELLLHTRTEGTAAQQQSSHSLQINDRASIALACLFVEELEHTVPEDQSTALAVLLALMLRLQKSLRSDPPKIANTSRPPLPTAIAPPNEHTSNVCRHTAIFILMHLHEPLSVSQIAREAGLSSAHLNRLFRRFYGVSVMHYVRQQRIIAAKKILEAGTENIGEIAQLVGFKRAAAFCSVFRSETGFTPNQFRHRIRHPVSLESIHS